jgi:alkylation response protein AidB-like acyl-CoA dehydrogenase
MDDSARVEKAAQQVVETHDPRSVSTREFLGACFDAGLAWVHFPEGLGGLGVSRGLQARADAILQGAGAPNPFFLNCVVTV